MTQVLVTTVGENKGALRIWMQGQKLKHERFVKGTRYNAERLKDGLALISNPEGKKVVSGRKKGDNVIPIIDLNNQMLSELFDLNQKLRIVIRKGKIIIKVHFTSGVIADRINRLKEVLKEKRKLAVGSLFHGGGVIDKAIHSGLSKAGVSSFVQVAVELEEKYLDSSMINNSELFTEETIFVNSPLQDLNLAQCPKIDLAVMGIPCTGASSSGMAKNKLKHAEEHSSAGGLFFWALQYIQQASPSIFVIENVKNYQNTASMAAIRSVANTLGYDLQERIMNGNEFGALENRDRLVVVGITRGLDHEFDLESVLPQLTKPAKLSDVLEDIPLDSELWKEFSYLVEKEKRDKAAGKGFRRQLYTGENESINTVTREYHKCRSTDPFIQHPDGIRSRLLTVAEHAAVKGVPLKIVAGLSKTVSHEVLGQGIIYPVFEDLGMAIGTKLNEIDVTDSIENELSRAA